LLQALERQFLYEQGSIDFHFELNYEKHFGFKQSLYATNQPGKRIDWYSALRHRCPQVDHDHNLEYGLLGLSRLAMLSTYHARRSHIGVERLGPALEAIEPQLVTMYFNRVEDPLRSGEGRTLPVLSYKVPKNHHELSNQQRAVWLSGLCVLLETFDSEIDFFSEFNDLLIERQARVDAKETAPLDIMHRRLYNEQGFARNVFFYQANVPSGDDHFQVAWTGR
jgi:hypothetical protein